MRKRSSSVVDTGVLVSAFVFGGIPMRAVNKAFKETVVHVSPQLLYEYREVPRELLAAKKINDDQFKALISGIAAFAVNAILVNPISKIDICRDKEDNMLLECCFTARSEYLITGDKDLLTINILPFKLKIVSPRMFINE